MTNPNAAAQPQPAPTTAQPLWDWYRIDEEMEEQYKAHGDTYQFIWVRYLLRKMCEEYEATLAAKACPEPQGGDDELFRLRADYEAALAVKDERIAELMSAIHGLNQLVDCSVGITPERRQAIEYLISCTSNYLIESYTNRVGGKRAIAIVREMLDAEKEAGNAE